MIGPNDIAALLTNLDRAAWNLNMARGLYHDEHELALAMATIDEALRTARSAIETHHIAYEARWRERQRRKGVNP